MGQKRKHNALNVTNLTAINKTGYQIYKSTLRLTADELILARLMAENGITIFNHWDIAKDDSKRIQTHFSSIRDAQNQTDERMQVIEKIQNHIINFCHTHVPGNSVQDPVFILSLPGCNEQPPHCDYNPASFEKNIYPHGPFGLLLCLEEQGTQFVVWEGSHRTIRRGKTRSSNTGINNMLRKVICLDPGDILIFRGDLVHAGAGFDNLNVRVHCYLDHADVERGVDITFPVT